MTSRRQPSVSRMFWSRQLLPHPRRLRGQPRVRFMSLARGACRAWGGRCRAYAAKKGAHSGHGSSMLAAARDRVRAGSASHASPPGVVIRTTNICRNFCHRPNEGTKHGPGIQALQTDRPAPEGWISGPVGRPVPRCGQNARGVTG